MSLHQGASCDEVMGGEGGKKHCNPQAPQKTLLAEANSAQMGGLR